MGLFDRIKQKIVVNDKQYNTHNGKTHITSNSIAGMNVDINERGTSTIRKFTDVSDIIVDQETNNVILKKNDGSVIHLQGEFTSVHGQDIPVQDVDYEQVLKHGWNNSTNGNYM